MAGLQKAGLQMTRLQKAGFNCCEFNLNFPLPIKPSLASSSLVGWCYLLNLVWHKANNMVNPARIELIIETQEIKRNWKNKIFFSVLNLFLFMNLQIFTKVQSN